MAPNAGAAPDWRALLDQAVVDLKTKQAVAIRLGVSRPYVSRVMNGGMDPVPPKFIDLVINRFHVVAECPATERPQPRSECRRIALGPAPTHNPLAMRIWKCCQSCPHKPTEA